MMDASTTSDGLYVVRVAYMPYETSGRVAACPTKTVPLAPRLGESIIYGGASPTLQDWTDVPDGFGKWVGIIDGADKASTMFRYPFTKDPATDKLKSAFKPMLPAAIATETQVGSNDGSQGLMIMALKNDKNEIVETFVRDDAVMSEVYDALKQLADRLTGVNLGLLCELVES